MNIDTNSDNFNYSGYQVVRGEFFAHLKEPSITFNNCKIYVNSSCLNKFPNTEFIQILVNKEKKKLVVRPCTEDERDSFCWCSKSKKRKPKHITCRIFYAKIFNMMNWNPEYRYKLIGKLINSNNESIFVFDLNAAQTYRKIYRNNISEHSRQPSFPSDWREQFGIPYEEHQKSLKINILDGYAVFELKEKIRKDIKDNEQYFTN